MRIFERVTHARLRREMNDHRETVRLEQVRRDCRSARSSLMKLNDGSFFSTSRRASFSFGS
jgi:hypothetical protein